MRQDLLCADHRQVRGNLLTIEFIPLETKLQSYADRLASGEGRTIRKFVKVLPVNCRTGSKLPASARPVKGTKQNRLRPIFDSSVSEAWFILGLAPGKVKKLLCVYSR
jgi:hypothetical protein